MVKVKAKIKIEVTINHGISIVQDCCLQCKRTAGIPNNKMLFWQVSVDLRVVRRKEPSPRRGRERPGRKSTLGT
jgi:hypothetical protein